MPVWQPQWLSVVKLNRDPQFLRIKSRLYTAEGIERTQDIFTASEEGIVRINVSFELLWRNVCVSEELTPIAYDIYGLGLNSISELDAAGAKNYPSPSDMFCGRATFETAVSYSKTRSADSTR